MLKILKLKFWVYLCIIMKHRFLGPSAGPVMRSSWQHMNKLKAIQILVKTQEDIVEELELTCIQSCPVTLMDINESLEKKRIYSQLSISSVQFCSSSGYLLRSIMQAAVVVILKRHGIVIRSLPCTGRNRQETWVFLVSSRRMTVTSSIFSSVCVDERISLTEWECRDSPERQITLRSQWFS